MIIAHVGGIPVEEMLPTLVGASTGLLIVRARMMMRTQRRRERAK